MCAQTLVDDDWFVNNLTASQLAELRSAQSRESEMPAMVDGWRANHAARVEMAKRYVAAPTEEAAGMARAHFDSLTLAGDSLEVRAAAVWASVFDSKSYLYNLAADKTNSSGLLNLFAASMSHLRERRAALGDANLLIDYALQKRMMTSFEAALATQTGNLMAADSLRKLVLPSADSMAKLGPVELRERLFLDYGDVAIGRSPYSSSKPIPELKVWPRGIIYRVMLGVFSARQPVGIFRGAWPLAVERGEDNKYRYYAGGFATAAQARQAVARLQKAGFRAPAVAVWMDGVLVEGAPGEKIYRVELAGELPGEIRAMAPQAEIVRAEGGDLIVTGLDAEAAEKIRAALEIFPDLEARLSK